MHTPTPYRYDRNWRNEQQPHDRYIRGNFREAEDEDELVCMATSVAIVPGNATSGTIADDTAAFIVLACNAHEPLTECVKAAQAYILTLRQMVYANDVDVINDARRRSNAEGSAWYAALRKAGIE